MSILTANQSRADFDARFQTYMDGNATADTETQWLLAIAQDRTKSTTDLLGLGSDGAWALMWRSRLGNALTAD